MGGWAVLDVETTGLHPARDRIVEIAIIRLDDDGHGIDEWSSLVNPGDRAPWRPSGLAAADVATAPAFADLLNEVLNRVSGRVIAAHNAKFDVSFLQAETSRAGVAWGPVEGFCTMDAVAEAGIVGSRDLHHLCAELGIETGSEHVAIEDARAVVGLIAYLQTRLLALEMPPPAPTWPAPAPPPARTLARQIAAVVKARTTSRELLQKRVRVPPGLGIAEAAGSTYLGLLDLIVDDGRVTDDEVDALSLFASACGITRPVARRLNLAYLDEMRRLAEEDGVVTDDERTHLVALMAMLGRALPR